MRTNDILSTITVAHDQVIQFKREINLISIFKYYFWFTTFATTSARKMFAKEMNYFELSYSHLSTKSSLTFHHSQRIIFHVYIFLFQYNKEEKWLDVP